MKRWRFGRGSIRSVQPTLHLSLPVRDTKEAQTFYVEILGCELGRVRETWLDVWFYGMQLTLQERPEEVLPEDEQGVRHFGVTLDRSVFDALVARLEQHSVSWFQRVSTDTTGALDGKTSAKILDPSGNVIELKTYPDP